MEYIYLLWQGWSIVQGGSPMVKRVVGYTESERSAKKWADIEKEGVERWYEKVKQLDT